MSKGFKYRLDIIEICINYFFPNLSAFRADINFVKY